MNRVEKEDIQSFVNDFGEEEKFKNSKFLITGATGLIGSTLIHCLLALDKGIQIIAPIRNLDKAKAIFSDSECDDIRFVECDLLDYDFADIEEVDYVVHCAAPTSTKYFIEKPIETYNIIYEGTKNILEYVRRNPKCKMANLSSMEVYGEVKHESLLSESDLGDVDLTSVRSCYPIAKRAAEFLCYLYSQQFDLRICNVRLALTSGPGSILNDNRMIVQFAKKVVNNEDIILYTSGKSSRPYCYSIDAITAILYILLYGESGQSYNVANQSSYMSAREVAEFVVGKYGNIKYEISLDETRGYPSDTFLHLSTEKLESLGWKPKYSIEDIFDRLILAIRECGV